MILKSDKHKHKYRLEKCTHKKYTFYVIADINSILMDKNWNVSCLKWEMDSETW